MYHCRRISLPSLVITTMASPSNAEKKLDTTLSGEPDVFLSATSH